MALRDVGTPEHGVLESSRDLPVGQHQDLERGTTTGVQVAAQHMTVVKQRANVPCTSVPALPRAPDRA